MERCLCFFIYGLILFCVKLVVTEVGEGRNSCVSAGPPVPGPWQQVFVGIMNVVLDQKGIRFWLLGGRNTVGANMCQLFDAIN